MKFQRFLTGIIGFPIVAIVLVFGNQYLIDLLFAIVALLSIHEYFKAVKNKYKPVEWIGYLACILISFVHIIPYQYLIYLIGAIIPVIILILFITVIFTNMKITIVDIAVTFFGICYIALFMLFFTLIVALENGKLLMWYVLFAAWGTDTFAYFVGTKMGKHKISKISPKKSVEGAIGGTIAAIIISIIYTLIINIYFNMNINYVIISVISLVLSIIGQIGDFSASSIKRSVEIKDFSNLIPGHGGMLDRIDSIIFIAPFAYFLLILI